MEKIAFLFPGQGSQYVGMSKTFYDQFDIAKRTFEEANDILGFNLAQLCFEGSLAELSKIENALVALLVSSVTAFRIYMKEIGIAPQFCMGHSLGEYSALTCSGAISFSDAVKIVRRRGQISKEVVDLGIGAMTIIDGINKDIVEEECKKVSSGEKKVYISCYNSSKEIAISGHLEAVQLIEDKAIEMGGQITPLIGNAPFHSPLMKSAGEKLKEELVKYSYTNCRWGVISNVTALPYEGTEKIIDNLTNQIMKPVRWQDTIKYIKKYGITLTIEMGAKNVLCNLIKTEASDIETLSFDQKLDRQKLLQKLSNNKVYKKHVPTVITKCLAAAAATQNYNLDKDQYKTDIEEPYKRIQAIQDELEKDMLEPTVEQMKNAIKMLKHIFDAKKVRVQEQIEWFKRIIDETGTNYIFEDIINFDPN